MIRAHTEEPGQDSSEQLKASTKGLFCAADKPKHAEPNITRPKLYSKMVSQ